MPVTVALLVLPLTDTVAPVTGSFVWLSRTIPFKVCPEAAENQLDKINK